jgi:putative glutamine amidotransferase
MKGRKPVVGVIGSAHLVDGKFRAQRVGERNLRAVAETAGALPLIFAGSPEITDIGALFDTVDGILLTGARANVHPRHFGEDEDPRYEPYDPERDTLALELIQASVARGVPLFGICRGLQEMNVAYGGSLHPEIRDLPGRMNHRAAAAERRIPSRCGRRLRRPPRSAPHARRRLRQTARRRDHQG